LDGRGGFVALGADGAEERIGEAQIFKSSFRTQNNLSFLLARAVVRLRRSFRTDSR
jgi:hypothetical protein